MTRELLLEELLILCFKTIGRSNMSLFNLRKRKKEVKYEELSNLMIKNSKERGTSDMTD